jgi:transposase-like protein
VDGEAPLGGSGKVVEVDETYVGGKSDKGANWREDKTVVMGMMERDGDLVAKVVDDATRGSLMPQIHENIEYGTEIHTDELRSYKGAQMAPYTHKTVNHSKGEYVGPEGETTNSIENFFGHLKRSIAGTHISVSPKYLEAYVKEFEYRFNRRTNPEMMLSELLSRFPELDA